MGEKEQGCMMIKGVKKNIQKLVRLCYKKQSMKRKSLNVQKPKRTFTNNIKFQNLYSKFVKVINKHKIKNSFVVAVSGGPDSLVLTGISKFFYKPKKK